MKKLIFSLVVLLFSACSSSEEDSIYGQWLYSSDSTVAALSFCEGHYCVLTIYEYNHYTYQDAYGSFSINGSDVLCEFKGISISGSFDGGTLLGVATPTDTTIHLSGAVTFKADSQVLDINGDGILDASQDL